MKQQQTTKSPASVTRPGGYHKLDGDWPYHVVAGFGYDDDGNVAVLHRTDKVRSGKNIWSLPSGLHDIGVTMRDMIAAEFYQELGLELGASARPITTFDVIRQGEDKSHWVITIMAVHVLNPRELQNVEPEKHDVVKMIPFEQLAEMLVDGAHDWGQPIQNVMVENLGEMGEIVASHRRHSSRGKLNSGL